jgi:amino acid permease
VASYTGIIEAALGTVGGRLAEVMNLACCFGICSAYLVFVASTLATVLPVAGGQNAMVWAITPVMVALA